MTPEEIYLQNLGTIERIASFVARRNRLNEDDVSEFTQEVRVRLLEDDYAIIRKFRNRSSLSTYLTTVIARLFHHWRIAQWGKWRPSAEATRLGDKAIVVERLMTRDGYSLDETVKILTTPSSSQYTLGEIEAVYLRLPPRHPRPMFVSDEQSAEGIAVEPEADGRLEMRDGERSARTAASTIDELAPSMKPRDRLILQMRFRDALKVPDIAQRLNLDQKWVYKRLEQLCNTLRKRLEAAGVRRSDVGALLSRGDRELHFGFLHETRENGDQGPSHGPGGEGGEGGEDRLQ
jgi:RNA polymerase sigma factor (sigma-70 family)